MAPPPVAGSARASRSAPRCPSSSPSKLARRCRAARRAAWPRGPAATSQGTSPGRRSIAAPSTTPTQRSGTTGASGRIQRTVVHRGRRLGPGDERPRRDPGIAAEPPSTARSRRKPRAAGELAHLRLSVSDLVRRGGRREPAPPAAARRARWRPRRAAGRASRVRRRRGPARRGDPQSCSGGGPPGGCACQAPGQPFLAAAVVGRLRPRACLGLEQPPVPEGQRAVAQRRSQRRQRSPRAAAGGRR